jgi:C1A family cysteine protease
MSIVKIQKYGWKKDHLDHRDLIARVAAPPTGLPPSVDLRTTGFVPPVYDQLQLGSCTANAIAAAVDFERKKQGEAFLTPSRLFIYYNERVIEDTVDQDAGAEIRDGIKSVASQGVCAESEWPYTDQGTQFTVKPTGQCYIDALSFEALKYISVNQVEADIKGVLASGSPVVFGFSVFSEFESDAVAKTGLVPMPSATEAPLGGHAVLCVGYDDASQLFLVRNSWNTTWGQSGYFQLPYAYLLDANLASDLWVIQLEK